MSDSFNTMLKYYRDHEIIPVHQTLPKSDFPRFRFQRESLYRNLGVHFGSIAGKRVIEFGPGTGDNAMALASVVPSQLVLVDGNPSSIRELNSRFSNDHYSKSGMGNNISIIQNDVIQLKPIDLGYFDFVIAEGIINGQSSPPEFLRHVSTFVKPGGVLVITTVNSFGVLDQALRRTYLPAIKAQSSNFTEVVQKCAEVFSSHLSFLPTTKTIEDWVQDSITHPLPSNYIHSSDEAVKLLDEHFLFLGSSPKWHQDFRWHKSLTIENDKTNESFIAQSKFMNLLSLDDRMNNPLDIWLSAKNLDLEQLDKICRKIWTLSTEIVESTSYDLLDDLISQLDDFRQKTKGKLEYISESINEYLYGITRISEGEINFQMPNFSRWWGRGLNYLALVKRSEVEKA